MNRRRPMMRRLRNMLQNPDPAVRKQAVMQLTTIRNPNALWVLRFVSQNDTDADVRTLAQQGINQRVKGLQSLTTGPGATAQETHWDCVFCGTRDLQGAACPNCGAPRPTEADEKAAVAAVDTNTPAPDPFMAGPGGVPPMMRGGWGGGGWGRRRRANGSAFIFLLVVLFMFALMFAVLYGAVEHRFFLR